MAQLFLPPTGMPLLAVLVVCGLVLYFMTPEERSRLLGGVQRILRRAGVAASAGATRFARSDPFYSAVHQRGWPVITCALAAANLGVLVAMLLGPDALGSPDAMLAWGGNFGPRTTGDERWRVLTSIFVHRGILHLLVTLAVLVQLGFLLERIVGPFTFTTTYVASGVLASVISTAAAPMDVSGGAAGALAGLYGLLLVVVLRGLVQSDALRIPRAVLASLAPAAAVFVLYCAASGESWLTMKVGFYTGVVGSIVLTRRISDESLRLRRFAALGAATAGIVMMSAMGLRAVTDVRPALTEVIAAEERHARVYDEAVARFRKGHITTRELVQVIDDTIVPGVQQSIERFSALTDVPVEHQPLVSEAQQYLRLRHDGWRRRSAALQRGSMGALRDADTAEQAALRSFVKLRAVAAQ